MHDILYLTGKGNGPYRDTQEGKTMQYILSEYGEGHTHKTYYNSKEEAITEMERRAALPRTTYPMAYRVWSSNRYGDYQATYAEARRPATDGRRY